MDAERARIAFWPHTPSADVASTRIRCLQVIQGLQSRGVDAALLAPNAPAPDVLVLAKRYDESTLARARALRERFGTRLVLDICDNHFYYEVPDPIWVERAHQLRETIAAMDHVVVASDALADVVRADCGAATPISMIPDALDSGPPPQRLRIKHRLRQWLQCWQLRRFLRRHTAAPGRRLLWYGNHGSGNAAGGLLDLNRIADALERHHQRQALTLTIVSNSHETYRKLIDGWPGPGRVPTFYLPWSTAGFRAALSTHAIALVPAQSNPFTRCKTNNRLATAFVNGLAVAADALPAYEEFADVAVIDDWDSGLGALMDNADGRAQRVRLARERLQQRYSLEGVCQRWLDLTGRLLEAQTRELPRKELV